MNIFFFVLELLLYAFIIYLTIYKKALGFIYLPALFFIFNVINPIVTIGFFYTLIAIYVFTTLSKYSDLVSQNVWSVILIIYFAILLTDADSSIKYSLVFSALLLFTAIPLISLIYKDYSRHQVFATLTRCAILILVVFVLNAIMSTLKHYNPQSMYGINSGVLYGNLGYTDFNVIGIALFVLLLAILKKNNWMMLGVYVLALAFVILTLRRSVILVSGLSVVMAFLAMMTPQNFGKVATYMVVVGAIGTLVYFKSDFASEFNERYELRRLDEREFEEEKRFAEYEMLYKDMFVLKKYSPWFGYGLFNSADHYGEGRFEDRTLHADLPSIAHSSGYIGVIIYLLMMITAFFRSVQASKTREEIIQIVFCLVVFVIFTITGRYSQTDAMVMLFLVSQLGLASSAVVTKPSEDNQPLIQEGILQ